jgi:hypothetical protein
VLDTVRLCPTTPAPLRETELDTVRHDRVLPAGTQLLVFTLSYADSCRTLVPFGAGPAACPGRNVVLVESPVIDPARRLPATVDNVGMRFRVA